MAKPFTAIALLQLRDRGLLKLDDPVATHLPGFPYPNISLRHLLSHTSGLPDLELFEALVAADPDRIVTGGDLLPSLNTWTAPLAFPPGERFRYSNVNYQVLAEVVARVGGQSFAGYMADKVFAPTGMSSSWVLGGERPHGAPAPVGNHILPTMYDAVPKDVRGVRTGDTRADVRRLRYKIVNLGSTVGDQNLFTTLDDLRRFDSALRSGQLLSLVSQEEAYTPVKLNDGSSYLETEPYQPYGTPCSYGLGWEVCEHPQFGRVVGHAGYNHGIATQLWRNPSRAGGCHVRQRRRQRLRTQGGGGDCRTEWPATANAVVATLAHPRLRCCIDGFGTRHRPRAARRLKTDPAWATTGAGMNRLRLRPASQRPRGVGSSSVRTEHHPQPDNAAWYDSLGEGLAANGRTADAIVAYRRSLELQPENPSGRDALKRLEDSLR